ncbi:MAG: EamA family transporter, partial [Pseudomonadota bacterium]|nr:EamA family transporter [Pseudomonadota bacterium]
MNRRGRATLIGVSAIAMWAGLALLTAMTGGVPPFQLLAMCFAVASGVAALVWLARGENPLRQMRLPAAVWLLGVGGLFGYHAAYFTALRHAPVVEASLIAYLWPLLIVVFSALLPGERLRAHHLLGAGLGFAGAVLLIGRGGLSFEARYGAGYAA